MTKQIQNSKEQKEKKENEKKEEEPPFKNGFYFIFIKDNINQCVLSLKNQPRCAKLHTAIFCKF